MVQTASTLLPFFFYFAVLYLDLPAEIGEAARTNRILLIPIILPVLYFAYAIHGKYRHLLALSATLILFALPLAGLWTSGASEQDVIAGLIPFSDARGYYGDALSLLNGNSFFYSPRPLFPAALASLLWLTRQNLQLSLAILTALAALACHLAARQLQRIYGAASATLLLVLLFFYYRRFSGSALTEHLGITLGALSLALFLCAAREHSSRAALVGIFLAALALNSRAGAFFILPCLILWAGWEFKGAARFSWSMASRAAGAVILAFLLNYLLFWLISDLDRPAFYNFSYTLYGLAAGGKGWGQFMIDHPEAVGHPEMVYGLAREAILSHPGNLLLGFFRSWVDFFIPNGQNDLFGFIAGLSNSWVNNGFRVALYGLSLWALICMLTGRKKAVNAMILWGLVGVLLSVPFVPPVDADVMRAYAASMALMLTLPAIGLKLIMDRIRMVRFSRLEENTSNSSFLPVLLVSVFLVFLAVLMPIAIHLTSPQQPGATPGCPVGLTGIEGRIPRGASVTLIRRGSSCGRLPNICYEDFLRNGMPASQEQFDELTHTIEKYEGNVTLASIFDPHTGQLYQILIPGSLLPGEVKQISACITSTTSGLQFHQFPGGFSW